MLSSFCPKQCLLLPGHPVPRWDTTLCCPVWPRACPCAHPADMSHSGQGGVHSPGAQQGPGESPLGMQPAMWEERAGWLPLLKRRAAEEKEAGRKEGLVCPFPEQCRNCYMRNYLTSNLQMLFTNFLV